MSVAACRWSPGVGGLLVLGPAAAGLRSNCGVEVIGQIRKAGAIPVSESSAGVSSEDAKAGRGACACVGMYGRAQRLVERRGFVREETRRPATRASSSVEVKTNLLGELLDLGRCGLGEASEVARRAGGQRAREAGSTRRTYPVPQSRRSCDRSFVRDTVLLCGPVARNRGEGFPSRCSSRGCRCRSRYLKVSGSLMERAGQVADSAVELMAAG